MTKYFNWQNKIDIDELKEIITILKNDGIAIFPTETVYGIGGNALSSIAIDRVYDAKQRPRDKATNILVASKEDIFKYADITSPLEQKIVDKYMPGPITIILKKKKGFGDGFTLSDGTIGVRIPDNNIILEILKNLPFPLIAPSANVSDKPSGISIDEIIKDFDGKADAIIDGGSPKLGMSSTIVKVENNEIKILRQGTLKIDINDLN